MSSIFSVSIAQEQHSVEMRTDSVIVLQTGINTMDIALSNQLNLDFEGLIELDLPYGLASMSGLELPVRILAEKKRFLSIKLRGNELSSLKGKKIQIRLLDQQRKQLSKSFLQIDVPDKRSVNLQDNSELQYLRNVGDSVHVKVRVINNGTTDEDIQLLFSSPDRVGNRVFKSHSLHLIAGRDSLIQMNFAVEKFMLELPQYTVRVSGIYENNDVFGHLSIMFSNISSNRNYQSMFMRDVNSVVYSKNYIDFQVNNAFDEQQMYFLQSEGEYRLSKGVLRYGTFINQMSDLKTTPNINNTYVEYERNQVAVTLGNLQESLEAPLYGRGAKVTMHDSVRSALLSAGVVERSGDLLGVYSLSNPGFTAFTRLVLADQVADRKRYEGQLYYDHNRIDSTESMLWANSFDFIRQELAGKIRLQAFVGAGVNRYFGNRETDNNIEPSAALGLKLDGRSGRWTYSSDNFYSTAYYPGNRRGAVQLTQRISRTIKNTNYGLGYQYMEYNPAYFSVRFAPYRNNRSRVDLSISMPVSSFVSLNFLPSYNREMGNYWALGESIYLTMNSWQLTSSANVRSRNYKHNLFLTAETGLVSMKEQINSDFIFRGNFAYNYNSFGLFGNYQKGAFQVYEILNSMLIDRPFGDRMSLGISYNGFMLQKKLTWNANVMANKFSGIGDSYAANLNASYRVLKNTMLTSVFQYSKTIGNIGYHYDFTNLRLGVRQNLPSPNLDRPVIKTGTIQVFCFYDNNYNDVFDEGDEIANGYGFMVRNVLFVTDKKGKASYKKMPYGDYDLFFPMFNGYQAVSKSVNVHSNNVLIEIPLQKAGLVKGRVFVDHDPNLSMPVDLNLDIYTLIAEDQNGKLFEVRTKAGGDLEISLPKGIYSFYLKDSLFPEHIYIDENIQHGTVEVGKTLQLEVFVLKVKSKKVEVKRFGGK